MAGVPGRQVHSLHLRDMDRCPDVRSPLFLGVFLALFVSVQENDAWSAVLGFLAFLVYLWLRGVGPWLIVVGIANALVLLVKHAGDLSGGVRPRRWLLRSVGGR